MKVQKECASQIHDDSGINQFAQKIFSSPGKQDGLYWRNADGSSTGPIGETGVQSISLKAHSIARIPRLLLQDPEGTRSSFNQLSSRFYE